MLGSRMAPGVRKQSAKHFRGASKRQLRLQSSNPASQSPRQPDKRYGPLLMRSVSSWPDDETVARDSMRSAKPVARLAVAGSMAIVRQSRQVICVLVQLDRVAERQGWLPRVRVL